MLRRKKYLRLQWSHFAVYYCCPVWWRWAGVASVEQRTGGADGGSYTDGGTLHKLYSTSYTAQVIRMAGHCTGYTGTQLISSVVHYKRLNHTPEKWHWNMCVILHTEPCLVLNTTQHWFSVFCVVYTWVKIWLMIDVEAVNQSIVISPQPLKILKSEIWYGVSKFTKVHCDV